MNKFETNELLKDRKLFTPIPKFFFRLWRNTDDLPASFWITLLCILDTTLGGSQQGIEGYLAQSQIPVDPHQSSRWIAAITGYGRVVDVTYSDGRNQKGSKFTLKPDATEEDWVQFVSLLRKAYRDGLLARTRTPAQIRKDFAKLGKDKPRRPLWSEVMRRMMCEIKDDKVDVWDDRNWIQRGFDWLWLFKEYPCSEGKEQDDEDSAQPMMFIDEFDGLNLENGEWLLLPFLFHVAWVYSREDDDAPLLPDDPKQLKPVLGDWLRSDECLTRVLAKFRKIEHPDWGAALENDWLTMKWKDAKADAKMWATLSGYIRPHRIAC